MNIGIVGSGNVGRALAEGLAGSGHAVRLGARDAAKLEGWSAAPVVSQPEAARFGEVLVFAPSWSATQEVVAGIGAPAFAGKVVIDVTNPIAVADGRLGLAVGTTDSAGERLQRLLPEARVVKAFNTVGAAIMAHPGAVGDPDMPIAGDDAGAKAVVASLLRELGWGVADLGGLEAARWLEALVMAGISYGRANGARATAFKFLSA